MKITLIFLNFYAFFASPSPDTRNKAALRVLPNRSQFFQYESVSLSCEQQGNSSGWTIMRNTCTTTGDDCFDSETNEVDGYFDAIYSFDSGAYWCESAAGERSEVVNITVTGKSVILQSPALPVKEGDDVTLQCSNKLPSISDFTHDFILGFPKHQTADFYKDGVLIGSSSTGDMTIQRVSKSDEGFYKCNISGAGESPNSWMSVQGESIKAVTNDPNVPAVPVMSVHRIIGHAVIGIPYLLSTIILVLIYRDTRRGRNSSRVEEEEGASNGTSNKT